MIVILSKVSLPELNKRKEFTYVFFCDISLSLTQPFIYSSLCVCPNCSYQPPLRLPSLTKSKSDTTTTTNSKRPSDQGEMDLDQTTSTTVDKDQDTTASLKKKRRKRSSKKKMEGEMGGNGEGEVSIGREMDLNP